MRAAQPADPRWASAPKSTTPKRVVLRILRDGPQRHERPLGLSCTQEGGALSHADRLARVG